MDSNFDVITAFVDGERVDPAALEAALATADGRAYFTDIVALREVVRTPDTSMPAARKRKTSAWRWAGIAAMVVAGVAGGLVAGTEIGRARATAQVAAADTPPAPSRVIKLTPGMNGTDFGGR